MKRIVGTMLLALLVVGCSNPKDLAVDQDTVTTDQPVLVADDGSQGAVARLIGTVWRNGDTALYFYKSGKGFRTALITPKGHWIPELGKYPLDQNGQVVQFGMLAPSVPMTLQAAESGVLSETIFGKMHSIGYYYFDPGGVRLRFVTATVPEELAGRVVKQGSGIGYSMAAGPRGLLLEGKTGNLRELLAKDTPLLFKAALADPSRFTQSYYYDWRRTGWIVPKSVNDTSTISDISMRLNTPE